MNFLMANKTKEIPFFRGRCLYKFLVSKGAYRQYLFNSLQANNKRFNSERFNPRNKIDVLTWLDRNPPMSAFSWHCTPEGVSYWCTLSIEWNTFYREKMLKLPKVKNGEKFVF